MAAINATDGKIKNKNLNQNPSSRNFNPNFDINLTHVTNEPTAPVQPKTKTDAVAVAMDGDLKSLLKGKVNAKITAFERMLSGGISADELRENDDHDDEDDENENADLNGVQSASNGNGNKEKETDEVRVNEHKVLNPGPRLEDMRAIIERMDALMDQNDEKEQNDDAGSGSGSGSDSEPSPLKQQSEANAEHMELIMSKMDSIINKLDAEEEEEEEEEEHKVAKSVTEIPILKERSVGFKGLSVQTQTDPLPGIAPLSEVIHSFLRGPSPSRSPNPATEKEKESVRTPKPPPSPAPPIQMDNTRKEFTAAGPQGYPMQRRMQKRSPPQQVEKLPAKAISTLVGRGELLIGKYHIVKQLGRGSQGVVHKCRDLEKNQFVAIKSMPVAGPGRRWNRSSPTVSREVAILKKLNHPNLVSLIGVMNDDGAKLSHVVIEYVDGGPPETLSDHALLTGSGTGLGETNSRTYFRQLVSALSYLHYHNILHRDIKPSNLLIDTKTGVLKLTDFGIAIRSNSEKFHRVLGSDDNILAYANVSGTPAFLPPEYYKLLRIDSNAPGGEGKGSNGGSSGSSGSGRKLFGFRFGWGFGARRGTLPENSMCSVDMEEVQGEELDAMDHPPLQYFNGRPADIWAAGVTLYAFAFGRLPFAPAFKKGVETTAAQDLLSLQNNIMDAQLRFPGSGIGGLRLSSELKKLLGRMLEKDPLKRIQMHELLVNNWMCQLEPMPAMSGEQKSSVEPTSKEMDMVMHELKKPG